MAANLRRYTQSPIFYFKDRFNSDRDWVLSRMALIPAAHKEMVTLEYERLYKAKTPGHRENANTYLQEQAKLFKGQHK